MRDGTIEAVLPVAQARSRFAAYERITLEEPIKTLGEFSVPIRLHPEVTAQLKVSVTRE